MSIDKYTLDMLTQDSVSVKKQKYTIVDGVGYAVGEPWRRAYMNSLVGRIQVQEEVPEPYRGVIMLMWGDTPTVKEGTLK